MHRKDIYTFMDGLTWLFQIIMFLCLGLLVNPHEMLEVAAVALLIGVFMIIIGRPLSVFLCLLPFRKITLKSRIFVSWVRYAERYESPQRHAGNDCEARR